MLVKFPQYDCMLNLDDISSAQKHNMIDWDGEESFYFSIKFRNGYEWIFSDDERDVKLFDESNYTLFPRDFYKEIMKRIDEVSKC